MKRGVAPIGLAVAGLGLAGAGCKSEPAQPDGPPPGWRVQVGQPAPEFLLVNTDGEKVRLADQRGKVVVANFFATWCGFCREEVAGFQKQLIPKARNDPRIAVFTIAQKEMRSTVAGFMRQNQYTWPFLLDTDGEVFSEYAISGLPRLVVIDHEGRVAGLHAGFGPGSMEQLLAEVERLLAQVPPGTPAAPQAESGTAAQPPAGPLVTAGPEAAP